MAENVQWIRLKVGMFDGNSFKKIKRAKIGGVAFRDKLTAVWFELLDLAGKSNANGYLVDSNEIPYNSFDDIAIMLDREEKEIELCMQFFINEKMVEIVDDIFCLTNFMQYQNQDGLDRIREQRRLSQAKWRDRKKQGLIGKSVDTTVETTSILPSISLSNSISTIFDYWNAKNIIKHRELTEDIKKAVEKALKTYKADEIKIYIDRYAKVIGDKTYFWHYKWSLKDFLSRKDGISSFTDEGSKWINYCESTKGTTDESDQGNNRHSDIEGVCVY
jgi:predicted phage replisome organizer